MTSSTPPVDHMDLEEFIITIEDMRSSAHMHMCADFPTPPMIDDVEPFLLPESMLQAMQASCGYGISPHASRLEVLAPAAPRAGEGGAPPTASCASFEDSGLVRVCPGLSWMSIVNWNYFA